MKTGEYDIKEMKALLESMSGMYDFASVKGTQIQICMSKNAKKE